MDVRDYALGRFATIERRYKWQPGVGVEWKSELRRELRDCIGIPCNEGVALEAEFGEEIDKGDYLQRTVTYATRPGLRAFGYLLTPKDLKAPAPAVVCVPGHGPGVDSIVGEAPADYQKQFAIQCVRQGYVALAIEPIGFGHRMFQEDANQGSSCRRDSMLALMLGETMIGWRCHDASASYDLLASLPNVDSSRVAIMGISGGGLVAFWTACLDERFAASVVSGYFNTFFDSILSIGHCPDNYAPGLANLVEMPDMAALIAPRKLFVESGVKDPIFPAAAFTRACELAIAIYEDAGSADAFGSDLFDDDHVFDGRKAFMALQDWLKSGSASCRFQANKST